MNFRTVVKSNRYFVLVNFLSSIRRVVVNVFIVVLGPIFLLCLMVARVYSSRCQLRRCTSVGCNVKVGFDLQIDNYGQVCIGSDVSIACRVQLSSYVGGGVVIGDNCFLGDNLKIVSDQAMVFIGDNCLIAENVSIRASNHGTCVGSLMVSQANSYKDIFIGNDVWIGRGVAVLAGSHIADGCVIGANSVVLGDTEPNTIYAGLPIRKIRRRG